jgi:hypothetical protein
VTYNASRIANLEIIDPWRGDPDYRLPPVELVYGRLKEQSGKVVEAWDTKLAAQSATSASFASGNEIPQTLSQPLSRRRFSSPRKLRVPL